MAQSYDFPLGVSRHDPNFEKILRMIVDFRGYETLDSLKAADDRVRLQLADQLKNVLGEARMARKMLADGMHLQVLADFDRMAGRLRAVCEMMARPEAGGLAACHRYMPAKGPISELYSIDFRMLNDAGNVFNLMQEFQRMAREDMILGNIHKIDVSLNEIADCLRKKGEIIGCMTD